MALWGYRPVLPEFAIENPGKDFKSAQVIEQYHLSARALYIPGGGFSWKYLLKEDVHSLKKGKWFIQSENGVAPFAMEAPALRLQHAGGETILELEKEKNALKALDLIGHIE